MAIIKKIYLNNFRNFKSFNISFNSKCNIFFGNNGSGKTNLLESISILGKGRGLRNSNISNIIFKKENNFIIESELEHLRNLYSVKVYSEKNNDKYKKITSLNDEISKEANNFINSNLSFLFFLPEMERLFLSSPSLRRNFIDKLIYSEQKNYNKIINKYKKLITERSKLLQQDSNIDETWISVIEKEVVKVGIEIYNQRKRQENILNKHLNLINSNKNYPFRITLEIEDGFYNEDFNEEKYLLSLKNSRSLDRKSGGSQLGPHKSDFNVKINENIPSSQLSTGQQKTIVLMLLISQCNYLTKEKNLKPILLFDEICSHLDDLNRKILLDMIKNFDIQFFLTGTEKNLFSFISTNAEFYNITDL